MESPENRPKATIAHPPETLEGWYALHQIFSIVQDSASSRVESTQNISLAGGDGWTAFARLIGSKSDLIAIHFRPTLDAIADAQRELARQPIMRALTLEYSFLSVTEAG